MDSLNASLKERMQKQSFPRNYTSYSFLCHAYSVIALLEVY